VTLSKRAAWFLITVGAWSWVIWPTFLRNVWRDDRSWHDGPTGFFLVHLVLTVVSLAFGTAVGWLGVGGVRAGRSHSGAEDPTQFYRKVITLPAGPGSADPDPDSGAGGQRHRRRR
jgi:hypothetical protein